LGAINFGCHFSGKSLLLITTELNDACDAFSIPFAFYRVAKLFYQWKRYTKHLKNEKSKYVYIRYYSFFDSLCKKMNFKFLIYGVTTFVMYICMYVIRSLKTAVFSHTIPHIYIYIYIYIYTTIDQENFMLMKYHGINIQGISIS